MANSRISRLVSLHQWQALMDILPDSETVLHFDDIASFECFRVRVNQTNAFGKVFNMSVKRSTREIRISRV